MKKNDLIVFTLFFLFFFYSFTNLMLVIKAKLTRIGKLCTWLHVFLLNLGQTQ